MLGWLSSTKSCPRGTSASPAPVAPSSLMASPRRSGTASDWGFALALEARSQQS
jgi:hypothetical protein